VGGHHKLSKASLAGLLIALGIIYGDIGTSPLYTIKAIIGKSEVTDLLVIGGYRVSSGPSPCKPPSSM